MIEQQTPNLGLQLPHPANELAADVIRLRAALNALDTLVSQKFGAAEVAAAIAAVVAAAPGALDTLQELSAAMGDDPNFATTILSAIAAAQAASMPVGRMAGAMVLGGIKIGPGLTINEDGVASVPSAANGVQTFVEQVITPASDGLLSFAVTGGYVPGLIELHLNGVQLIGGGDDYTATDGANLLLSFAIGTADKLLVRKWSQFESTNFYTRQETEDLAKGYTKKLSYDNRSALRSAPGWLAVVDGLGLFEYAAGSDEPDDDESCFATASGRWLLQAAHWDLVAAWQLPDDQARDDDDEDEPSRIAAVAATEVSSQLALKILTGTATCGITTVNTLSSASFTGTVAGAAVGDRVFATPPAQLGTDAANTARLNYSAWVSSANTVTVMLTNPSASSASTNAAVQAPWPITVIKT